MEVRPVGVGPSAGDLSGVAGAALPAPRANAGASAGSAPPPAVIDAAALAALSEPDLSRLLTVLERPPTPESTAQWNTALQAAVTAAATGDLTRALDQVTLAAGLQPLRAEALRSQPGLEPIRAQVDSLLVQLARVAHLDAEGRLAHAADLVQTAVLKNLPQWDARPETLLALAHRLLDAGGHTNSVRAAEVAQVVIDAAHWAPAAAPTEISQTSRPQSQEAEAPSLLRPAFSRSWVLLRSRAPGRIRDLWRRAPLLVLLLGWFLLGFLGGVVSLVVRSFSPESLALTGVGFDLWALGFLALVLFGFYMRVRNVRF